MWKKFDIPVDYNKRFERAKIASDIPIVYAVATSFQICNKNGEHTSHNKPQIFEYLLGKHYDDMCFSDLAMYQQKIDWYLNYLSYKVMDDTISPFEKASIKVLQSDTLGQNYTNSIGIISVFPKVYTQSIEREKFSEKLDELRGISNYFGEIKKRYNLSVTLLSKKYISNKGIWIINCADDTGNMFFFFDKSDNGYNMNDKMKIRATVKKHIDSDFTGCKETHLGRVVYS